MFPVIGRGVVTTREFKRGEFVIEYVGQLLALSESKEKEKQHEADQSGSYMLFFKSCQQSYWLAVYKTVKC